MAPMRVIQGTAARHRQSAIEAAYDHFRVDRQGNLVSGNTLNTRIATVAVVPVTTNLRWARAPGNVFLPRGAGGLLEDSVANVTQVATVDRADLGDQLGKLDAALIQQVNAGLR